MSEQQKSFVKDTWDTDDTVMVGGLQGTIKLFHTRKEKVHIEFIDADGRYRVWHDISELPPYPTADEKDVSQEQTFEPGHVRTSHGGNGPSLEVVKAMMDDSYLCEVTFTGGRTQSVIKTDDEIQAWGKPKTLPKDKQKTVNLAPPESDKPIGVTSPPPDSLNLWKGANHQMQRDNATEDEIYFEVGHKREKPDGAKLTVKEPTVKGKYNCHIHPAKRAGDIGGVYTEELTWQAIRDWGDPLVEASIDEKTTLPRIDSAGNRHPDDKEASKPEKQPGVIYKKDDTWGDLAGTSLTITEVLDDWNYMCVITFADGSGHDPHPKTWQEIRDWVQSIVDDEKEASTPAVEPVPIPFDTDTEDDTPPPMPKKEIEPKLEVMTDHFTLRERRKFHHDKANAQLQKWIDDGWTLEHIEHQTHDAYDGYGRRSTETVVYWTLLRIIIL